MDISALLNAHRELIEQAFGMYVERNIGYCAPELRDQLHDVYIAGAVLGADLLALTRQDA